MGRNKSNEPFKVAVYVRESVHDKLIKYSEKSGMMICRIVNNAIENYFKGV
jgi:hypothetical protein